MPAKAMAKAKKPSQPLTIPKSDIKHSQASSSSPLTPKTPKTPADEGLEFFESAFKPGDQPIRVYELQLDPDGGPNKDRSVAYPSVFSSTVC